MILRAQATDMDDVRPEATSSCSLPTLHITVFADESRTTPDNDILSRNKTSKEFFYGSYWLETNNCEWLEELGAQNIGSRSEPLPLQIKLRGNHTLKAFSKKPFKLKLDKKQRLLGL
ncbi:MAG: hypothetical protein K2N10_07625 [Muribaculaceae bacterium]|nr:hypothetical protein [Muribaculaceae bacterium]